MQKARWANYFHVASNEQNNYHGHCKASSTCWCQYQRDIINKRNVYKHGRGLSQEVIKWVKPIYRDLIKPSEFKNAYMGKHKIKMRVLILQYGNEPLG